MIDTHCHLEQPDYDKDRDVVIERCKKELDAVITSCAHPKHFELTMQLVKKYPNFIYATASVHPEYIKEIGEEATATYIEQIERNKGNIVAIGETGLDYNWVKDEEGRKKQRELFVRLIKLARELQLPLVIHSRDATAEVVEVLEREQAEGVQMHMFTSRQLLQRVLDNDWFVSVNTLLMRSKGIRKIVRDCPLERLMLETDAPWLGVGGDGEIKPKEEVRNEPTAVKLVVEKIAEIKKVDVQEVEKRTTENAKRFFNI